MLLTWLPETLLPLDRNSVGAKAMVTRSIRSLLMASAIMPPLQPCCALISGEPAAPLCRPAPAYVSEQRQKQRNRRTSITHSSMSVNRKAKQPKNQTQSARSSAPSGSARPTQGEHPLRGRRQPTPASPDSPGRRPHQQGLGITLLQPAVRSRHSTTPSRTLPVPASTKNCQENLAEPGPRRRA